MSKEVPPSSHGWARAAWWGNTLFVQGLIVAFSLFEFVDGYPTFMPFEASAAVALIAALGVVLLRTRAPWVFLGVTTALNLYYTLEISQRPPGWGILVALPFAMYAVASTVSLRVALVAAAAIETLLVVTAVIDRGVGFPNVYPVTVTAFLATAVASGQLAATRRRLMESTEKRALEAERTREALAATKVAEHRLAMARDLHDIVGHEIAVIGIHAGAALRGIRDDASSAEHSLKIIESSANRILGEIGQLLRDLRTDGADQTPVRAGLASLPALTRTLAAGGLEIDCRIDDALPVLDPETGAVVYRILEEALVNAYKHGTPTEPATAAVEWDGTQIVLTVSNPVASTPSAPGSGGLGVIGMRERAEAVGGTTEAELDGGRFTLVARIPVQLP